MIKINATARLKATQVLAEDGALAPAESFRDKNEKEFERQKSQRESDEHRDKESTSPTSEMSKTAVHDMRSSATARLKKTS